MTHFKKLSLFFLLATLVGSKGVFSGGDKDGDDASSTHSSVAHASPAGGAAVSASASAAHKPVDSNSSITTNQIAAPSASGAAAAAAPQIVNPILPEVDSGAAAAAGNYGAAAVPMKPAPLDPNNKADGAAPKPKASPSIQPASSAPASGAAAAAGSYNTSAGFVAVPVAPATEDADHKSNPARPAAAKPMTAQWAEAIVSSLPEGQYGTDSYGNPRTKDRATSNVKKVLTDVQSVFMWFKNFQESQPASVAGSASGTGAGGDAAAAGQGGKKS